MTLPRSATSDSINSLARSVAMKDLGSSDAVLYTQDTSMELPKDGVRYYRLEVITTPAK